MEIVKAMNANHVKSDFGNSAIATLSKIAKPKNKIIGRLKNQMQSSSLNEPITGYSRMHNRHNRS